MIAEKEQGAIAYIDMLTTLMRHTRAQLGLKGDDPTMEMMLEHKKQLQRGVTIADMAAWTQAIMAGAVQ